MTELGLDAAKEAKDEAQQGNLRENDAGITEALRVDYENSDVAEVSMHGESFVVFDHIARIAINDYGYLDDDETILDLEQNLEGAGRYGFTVELTVANPEVVAGEVWVDDPDAEWESYKITGAPDDDSNDYELREEVHWETDAKEEIDYVETKGINFGASNWDGKPVDDFDPDYIEVEVSSRRAQDILGSLDTAGTWFTDPDGGVVEGLFEKPPNMFTEQYDSDEDGHPRLVGYPELRADMVGQKGAITYTFGDTNSSGNTAVEADVFALDDNGNLEALVPVQEGESAYNRPTYPRGGSLMWSDVEDGVEGADAEPTTTDTVQDAQAMMDTGSDSTDGTSDETTYADLTDDAQAIVDQATTIVSTDEYETVRELDTEDTSTDYDSFDGRVTEAKIEDDIRVDADTLADIIDERSSS